MAAPKGKGGFFMFSFMVTKDGGLTTAGYGITIAIAVVIFFVAGYLAGGRAKEDRMHVKQLTFCGMALALAYLTSYIQLFRMPYGGGVTLFSMLFVVLIGYWYGPKVGVMAGFVYGILQFIQEPYVLSFFQVCCDYLLAFAALGLGGLFLKQKNGLLKGYVVAVIARGAFHVLGGYLFWMSYMPENFPKVLAAAYPFVYNYGFLLAEGALTILVLQIPALKNALERVSRIARGEGEAM